MISNCSVVVVHDGCVVARKAVIIVNDSSFVVRKTIVVVVIDRGCGIVILL